MNQNDLLQTRLDQNYQDYVAQLQGKTADELIVLASEIVAAQQLRDELACACSEEDAAVLLQFDDPLEEMRGFWASEQDGCHSEEIGHMIGELQCRGGISCLATHQSGPEGGQNSTIPPQVGPGEMSTW